MQVNGNVHAASFTGSLFGTASWATNFITGSVTSASYAFTASSAVNSFNSISSSYAFTASSAISSSRAITAISSSYAFTASSAINSFNTVSASYAFTASSAVNSFNAISSSYSFTASSAVNSTNALTASYILNAISASYAFTASSAISASRASSAISASYAFTASSAVNSFNATSASYAFTAFSAISASFSNNSISASYAFTASSAVNSTNALTASSADNFVVRQSVTASSALITGVLTAQTLVVSTVSSSVVYSSGSNIFGNQLTNVQQFTGSLRVTGSGPHYIMGGNVGIGTINPTNEFIVRGNTVGYDKNIIVWERFADGLVQGTLGYGKSSENNIYIGSTTNHPLVFQTNNTERARIDISGNVGIGTTTPVDKFSVSSGSGASMSITTGQQPGSIASPLDTTLNFRGYANGIKGQIKSRDISSNSVDGVLIFSTANTSSVLTENMRITATGNVGIGTTTVTLATLQVNGNVHAASFTGSLFGTASWAQNFVTSSVSSASFASFATSASYAATASYSSDFVVASTLTIDQTLTDYATVASSIVGSNNLFTRATGSFTSAFFKYTVTNGVNSRSGEVIAVWNGSTAEYTDFSTVDIGNTSAVTASASIVTSQIQFNMQTNTTGWRIKSLATFM